MEFSCARCGGQVVDGYCKKCASWYLTRCPKCGNTLAFEAVVLEGQEMLRCQVCDNDTDLQMQALGPMLTM